MKKLLALLIACLALTLTLAACGGDDDDGGGSSATPSEQSDTTPKAGSKSDTAGGGGSASVKIPAISFEPSNLTVKAGTTVTWTNDDDLPHTVTKDGGPGEDFDSGTLSPGDTFEQTFDAKGKVDYVCTIHPGQAGSITVE